MKDVTPSPVAKPGTEGTRPEGVSPRAQQMAQPHLSWTNFVKLICGIVAILLIVAVVVKLVSPASLTEIKLEVILLALAIAILIPYVSHFEALGIKVDVREQVEELSKKADELTAWTKASPYYTLASEYEDEGDYLLAEQYYQKSLGQCPTFWPSIFGLASVYDEIAGDTNDPNEYSKAIANYQKVIALDADNIYSYNNLAADYLNAPPPVKDPQKALDFANKALSIIPSFASAFYYRGVALNHLKCYQEARKVFQDILDYKLLEDYEYWAGYELAIANSNLGTSITRDGLDQLLQQANEKNGADRLLDVLSWEEEQERFSVADRPVIQQFLMKNKK